MTRTPANFDGIARPYRILEYMTLGRQLERTREHFLPALSESRNALVLGDGDGRFLRKLLEENPQLRATAVDTSAAMLDVLGRRCSQHRSRLRIEHADARQTLPRGEQPYDLVVTHFFLDCFTQDELRIVVERVRPLLAPGALWVVSDFRVPGGVLQLPAWLFIRGLYLCFRTLTGLRTTRLPDHASAFGDAGFTRKDRRFRLMGVLVSEFWQAEEKDAP